ncbi:TetR/AcrR family transcriptional regulator C-terminal domain-containing protein [Methanomethylophilus alvi]|jgi:probable dihydroxyacetone kinase regulator|uniref:TetR/AcrR family transcriptional regulator C-terminal domain-containing protein n=1 Tax=Methanomethylophilus alvi TaxID=1291540 RepID=UPI002A5854CD|nr:TetR/AcrR family transcriptional regulator C-terminal domain-containing protein [Methanomethylophilus alvi]MDD7480548.1 TetR/AcrR family transcriptional regulator C-terminal domain-containing protein [Methanomethylophilus alvi]MDY7059885.1 TetR/AcrR family transcriptional regulator C-terminal domain-containing protein [Methanomethylophilus alvi]
MSDLTKQALIASFKKLLETEPFDKITISDITNDCGLSRQTFYYHFRDIFDMIRWIYNSESLNEIGGRGGYGTWQDKIRELFDYTLNNKSLILGTFNSKCRNDLVGYYMDVSIRKISDIVEMKSDGDIAEKDKKFIASVYAYAFVGIMVDWISDGMKESSEEMVDRVYKIVMSNFDRTLAAFRQPRLY